MKKLLSALFLFMFLSSFTADEYILIRSIPFIKPSFTTDKLQNSYVIAGNQLLEFDSKGRPVATYSDFTLGTLRLVDASNPLKLVLFFPDFTQINILNSKLALESTINLRTIGILQPSLVCNSNHEGYWVYDMQDFKLKKVDLNLQAQIQSDNISQTLGADVIPNYLVEAGEYVYLNNPSTGILVFDLFGTYYKTIPILNLKSFQVIGEQLLYVENNMLMSYNQKTIMWKEIKLPLHDSLVNARIEDHELYLSTMTSLSFYSF